MRSALQQGNRFRSAISTLAKASLFSVGRRSLVRQSVDSRKFLAYSHFQKIPEKIENAVIGGGIAGASMLYALIKQAGKGGENSLLKNALFEKDTYAAGTTGHSVGLIGPNRETDRDIQAVQLTQTIIAELEQAGHDVGFKKMGSINVARTFEQLEGMKIKCKQLQAKGVNCALVSCAELKRLEPALNVEALCGALYVEGDATVDANALTCAYVKEAKLQGALAFEDCEVIGCEKNAAGDITALSIKSGLKEKTIAVNGSVVVAAGIYSGKIPGFPWLPVVGVPHQITTLTCGNQPSTFTKVIRDRHNQIYCVPSGEGRITVGNFNIPSIKPWEAKPGPHFSYEPPDYEQAHATLATLAPLVPDLSGYRLENTFCGVDLHSGLPDGRAVVGRERNLAFICAQNSTGVARNAGFSHEVAKSLAGEGDHPDFVSSSELTLTPDEAKKNAIHNCRFHYNKPRQVGDNSDEKSAQETRHKPEFHAVNSPKIS